MNESPSPYQQTPTSPDPAGQSPVQPAPQPTTGFQPIIQPAPRNGRGTRRKVILAAAITIGAVVIGGGTYVFGFYIPGRPENVWASGLGNTGKALDGLTASLTTDATADKLAKSQTDGKYSITTSGSQSVSVNGTFKGSADKTTFNYDANGTITSGTTNGKLDVQVIGKTAAGSAYPDTYVKLTGIKDLFAGSILSIYDQYDGQWISVPASYVEENLKDTKTTDAITTKDVTAAAKAASGVVRADVFTAKDGQSVLERQSFVGTEKKNGRDSYHYKALLNAARAKQFCSDYFTAIGKTTLYDKLKSADDSVSGQISDCQKSVDDSTATKQPFDVWVDSRYRVLSAVRMEDQTDKSTTEVGQKFDNLNAPTVYVSGSGDTGNGTATISFDKKSLVTTADLDITTKDADGSAKITAHATVSPFTGTVPFQAPASSTRIDNLFGGFGDTSADDSAFLEG